LPTSASCSSIISLLRLSSTAPSPPHTSSLSLHDALPISHRRDRPERPGEHLHLRVGLGPGPFAQRARRMLGPDTGQGPEQRADRDRKSTRLNSSHGSISYAVFCLKKKKTKKTNSRTARIS